VGFSLIRLKPDVVQALRRRPGPIPEGWERVPSTLLRYADEQTVAGVAAVFTAIHDMGVRPEVFADWGVVSASRFLGRAALAHALGTFQVEGVWGTSPHLIPHFALHSPSGTISLALGVHGPNLGVGGGIHAAAEGFVAALTWLAGGLVPGVWVVLSGWDPELVPGASAARTPAPDGECHALALALGAAGSTEPCDRLLPRVRVVTSSVAPRVLAAPGLPWLARRLEDLGTIRPRTIATDPSGTIRVELVPPGHERKDQDEDWVPNKDEDPAL
jgi:hypothetical protein